MNVRIGVCSVGLVFLTISCSPSSRSSNPVGSSTTASMTQPGAPLPSAESSVLPGRPSEVVTNDAGSDLGLDDGNQLNIDFLSGAAANTPFALAYGIDPTTGYIDAKEREAAIAECMTASGFDYVPYDAQLDTEEKQRITAQGLRLPTVTGYGMAMSLDPTQRSIVQLPADPNEKYISSLSPTAQEAYKRALFGDSLDGGSNEGCLASGDDLSPLTSKDLRAWLERSKDDAIARAYADPEVLAVESKWSACMAESGFSFASRSELLERLRLEFLPIYDSVAQEGSLKSASPDVVQRVQGFGDREKTIAQADIQCDNKTGYSAAYFKALLAAQQSIVDQHPTPGS